MTLINGSPAGPGDGGGSYPVTTKDDRSALFDAHGTTGVARGFLIGTVPGTLAMSFTAGSAIVPERDGSGNTIERAYHVWSDTSTHVFFDPPSASSRVDAVVAAFVDTEDGAVGTGGLSVGPQLVAVPGVSGTLTPRTDAQISAYLGRGGWLRLADQQIDPGDTEISTGGLADTDPVLFPELRLVLSSNQAIPAAVVTDVDGWGSAAVNRGYMWLPGDGADITIKKPGRYALTFTAQFEGGTGGSMAGISLNGSPIVEQGATNITYNEAGQRTANTIRRFAEGDVLRAIVAQNSGGTLQLQPTGGAGTTFDVVYVGP